MTDPVCHPFTVDPRFDDREAVVWILQSGGKDHDDHPVRRRERAAKGLLTRARSYAARDLLQCVDDDHQLELLKDIARETSWSLAYASFILHGFEVPEAEADLAIESLRCGRVRNQLIDAIVRTYDRLTVDLRPLHRAPPRDVLYVVATWPKDLRLRNPFFAWQAMDHLLEQHRALTEELKAARSRLIASINEGGDERHKVRLKKKSKAVVDRAETYLAVLALDYFKDERSSLDIARKVIGLTEGALEKRVAEDEPIVRLTSPEALERRLKERWNKMGLSAPDGRRASSQTVK